MILKSLAFSLLLVAGTLVGPSTVGAILIQLVYDPGADGIDPCTTFVIIDTPEGPQIGNVDACHAGVDRTPDLTLHLGIAAAHWERIFKDDHVLTIKYRWVLENLPSGAVTSIDAAARPLEGILRVPADFHWYYDPNPFDDDEFPMSPRLYRTLHPAERAEAISGTPPEVFEVAYTGTNTDLGTDLLTALFHEVGHILGLEPDVWNAAPAKCAENAAGAYYQLNPVLLGGAAVGLKAFEFVDENDATQFDCSHLALGGIQACKTFPGQDPLSEEDSTLPGLTVRECTSHQSLHYFAGYPRSRQRPEAATIFAIARSAGWQIVDLPRKFSLASGQWATPATWLGNRVPSVSDDVYIVNQSPHATITLFDPGEAGNITISDGSALQVFFNPLHVSGIVKVAGEGSALTVDTSATLEASQVDIGGGGLFDVPFNGAAELVQLKNRGVIRGAGSIQTGFLQNGGTIRGNGSTPLVFSTLNANASFDLTGTTGLSSIEALVGDLVFDAAVNDPVFATVKVGGGRSITFSDGWRHASGFPDQKLYLNNGSALEALIHGASTLAGNIEVAGIGRFTNTVVFQPSARLLLDISGLDPGTGFDQVKVGQSADLSGHLAVTLVLGYQPKPGDTYAVLTAGSVNGAFDTFTATLIPGGLLFVPQYGPTSVTLAVGFQGGTPGAPNCKGNAISQQVALHGSMKQAAEFFGLTVKQLQDAIKAFCD